MDEECSLTEVMEMNVSAWTQRAHKPLAHLDVLTAPALLFEGTGGVALVQELTKHFPLLTADLVPGERAKWMNYP